MTQQEYYQAQVSISRKKLVAQKEFINKPKELTAAFRSYFEALITIEGHGWCMDVKSERNKMAKLITKGFLDLQRQC